MPFDPTKEIDASKSSGLAAVVISRFPTDPLLKVKVAIPVSSTSILDPKVFINYYIFFEKQEKY